jgi:hypothetical protein
MSSDYPPTVTGLIRTGDVGAIQERWATFQGPLALMPEGSDAYQEHEQCVQAVYPNGWRENIARHVPYEVATRFVAAPSDVATLLFYVAALRREVRVLRQLNVTLQAEAARLRSQLITAEADVADVEAATTRLWLALQAARLPHAAGCLTTYNPAYPCSCAAGPHNARIAAALGESPDALSAPVESPGAETDH